MKTKTLPLPNSMNRPPLCAFVLIPLLLACFALSPTARATCQDACLTNNNTVQGDGALISLTTGTDNTAFGFDALSSDTNGSNNTATGVNALLSNTTGNYNTATGVSALQFNRNGFDNTAIGFEALYRNTRGQYNTATGVYALFGNTHGGFNTGTGENALYNNTNGNLNTANGFDALYSNISGQYNTATGVNALYSNTSGEFNTAIGFNALAGGNTTGNDNTAIGAWALQFNTIGSNNIALGFSAGNNLTSGSNNINIGSQGLAGESTTIRIGTAGTQTKTFIAGINGATVASGVGVIVGSDGQLGTVVSSARFKEEIQPMDKASEALLALKPVTFRYKKDLDSESTPQFGLVAEDVQKVNPDLVVRDEQGKPYTVRYEAVNAMLLNEFLKEHRKVETLEAKLAKLEATVEKVSAQLELSKSAPQVTATNQ